MHPRHKGVARLACGQRDVAAAAGPNGKDRPVRFALGSRAEIKQAVSRHGARCRLAGQTAQAPEFLAVQAVAHRVLPTDDDELGPPRVFQTNGVDQPDACGRRADRDRPATALARRRVDRRDERVAVVVVQHDTPCRRARPATRRCRSPDTSAAARSGRPERLAIEPIGEQADVAEVRRRGARRRSPASLRRTCSCDAGRRPARPCALRAPTSARRSRRRTRRPCSGSRRSRS